MNIEIDYELCTRCGLCSMACGSKRIVIGEDKKPYKLISAGCNDCGHCVAVCPENAVRNTRMDMKDFTEMVESRITTEQFMHLVRNRRSIRNYKKEPLKKEHIDKLLEVVKYIPTGSNKQSLKYKFITEQGLLLKIKTAMASRMRRVSNLINIFPVRYFVTEERRRSLQRLVDLWDKGNDTFLRGAPCLLIIYTEEKYFKIPQWDAGIASNTIDLAAQTLGVATLMNGYFVVLSNRYKSIRKLVQISGRQKILTAMCLGYPDIRYRKTVFRRPLEVTVL
jgi:nitroreductase/NAD-dependent dihydropyrimidine dehydrogenase PreA subunit